MNGFTEKLRVKLYNPGDARMGAIERRARQSAQGRQSSMFKCSMFKVRDRLNVEPGTLNHAYLLPWRSPLDQQPRRFSFNGE